MEMVSVEVILFLEDAAVLLACRLVELERLDVLDRQAKSLVARREAGEQGEELGPRLRCLLAAPQVLDLAIEVDLAGKGIDHAGIHVSAGTHVASVKTFGDQAGKPYESVNGVYDAGPAGLMGGSGGPKGLGGDGRPRLSFGNSQRG